ncbi:MAG: cysteine--tRNA ligase [Steroidobacteraceae bacterium]
MLIFNSLSGRKEEFEPLRRGIVRMYLCGDTVYDFCHIGHARSKVAFDVVRRYLEYRGYHVIFVRNITDVDDRIIRRAHENGESCDAVTDRFIRAMHHDYARIGLLPPTHEPRATAYIEEMIEITQRLIERGHAYVADDGDVMYSVSSFEPYGKLSGKRLSDLRAGARIEIDEAKRDPLDFVLWKQAKPGEPQWPSPWGAGRPGWHIECSAMSLSLLGEEFDIHAGGMDLTFPHHENEIAQSCAATGKRFARYWMHNGFVNVDDEKMSKSLGNFFTIRDILDSGRVRDPEVLRYFLMSSHYRGPINFSDAHLDHADAALARLYTALRDVSPSRELQRNAASVELEHVMDDDFNTPEALAVLQVLANELNRCKSCGDRAKATRLAAELRGLGQVLGILRHHPDAFLRAGRVTGGEALPAVSPVEIDALIARRSQARRERLFEESDRIRAELLRQGIVLEDGPNDTTWRRA